MLMTLGVALNAVAGVLFAVPVIGYIFGPSKRKEMKKELADNPGFSHAVPEGETRLANPILVRPWDGDTGNIPCCYGGFDKFQVFVINLHAFWLSGALVPQSGLHVSPSRRGVLR
jgi:hypothetical protein